VEAEMLSALEHPCIPSISDFFIEDNKLYLVMDYVRGETLKKLLKSLKKGEVFSEEQVLSWALILCDVLNYLHNLSVPIVFRDLKPDNIMLTPEGEIKLIDFGIARVFQGEKMDTTKYALFTEGYAPPEQFIGITDPRSDIYGLGSTLFHFLTGIHPKKVAPDFPPVTDFNSALSPELAKIIAKALEPKLKNRYQTILEMKQAFLKLREGKNIHEKVGLHIFKAREYEEKGDFFKANFEYMKALEWDSENYEVLTGIAECCKKLNFPDRAIHYYDKAMKLAIPEDLRHNIQKKLDGLLVGVDMTADFFQEEDEKTIISPLTIPPEDETVVVEVSQEVKDDSEKTGTVQVKTDIGSHGKKDSTKHGKTIITGLLVAFLFMGIFLVFVVILALNYKTVIKLFARMSPTPVYTPVALMPSPTEVAVIIYPTAKPEHLKISMAENYYKENNYDKALVCLEELLKEDPINVEALMLSADCYRKKENYDTARKFYKKVLEIDPYSELAHLGMGHIYRKEKNIEKAIEEYKQSPTLSSSHNNLGAIYANQGNMDEAIEEFLEAVKIDPHEDTAYVNLGSAYYHKKEWKKSIEYYSKAIEKNPENSETYYNLALSYKNNGNKDKAIKCFKEFIKLSPSDLKVSEAEKFIKELQ
ncbi:MAG TPA: tetratricopeptide repeat protein, partial [Candidatus Eremiobacteraeota bacterium]|nr:tetratricopeptide repeat protein [Candidatus Eremiobacteraeota bacterium]